jgi:hypothetical protein
MKCPGPAYCPFASEHRFRLVCYLVALLMALMASVAILAILCGKDGVITSAVCAAMSAVVTTLLVGGIHRHRGIGNNAQPEQKGGELAHGRPR